MGVIATLLLTTAIALHNVPESMTSGAMLYVVFGEILPQSFLMYHSKLPAFSAVFGMLVGMLIIFL